MPDTLLTDFCRSQVKIHRNNLDISDCSEISGMGLATSGEFLYMINDSPGSNARIFAYNKAKGGKPVTIEISGITATGFNPTKGQGFGDWEALAVGSHPKDPSMRCIIIADIGHNKARDPNGGVFRRDDQQTRFIYVEEPSAAELKSGAPRLVKPGYEFPFMYSSKNLKYDAEAMALLGDVILVITKNRLQGDKKSYVFACPSASLREGYMTHMALLGEMTIEFSNVTDAFATRHFLVLRTYISINFYVISDLRPGVDAQMCGCQRLDELKYHGQQEAIAYDPHRQAIFMIGEGSKELYSLRFNEEEAWAQVNKANRATGAVVRRGASGLTHARRPHKGTRHARPTARPGRK